MFIFKKKNLIPAISFFLLLLSALSLIPSLRPPLLDISRYPLTLISLIRREIGALFFFHHNFTENERLNNEAALLKKRINELREIYLENARLKGLLDFKQSSPYRVIAARVIGRSADSWSSLIIIDKGSSSGVKYGMPVITPLGFAGRVMETAKYTSKVMLLNHPDFAVSSQGQRSRQEGLVCGALGNFLMMRYLPKDCDIKVSDLIITSGLTGRYPKGLVIGSVVSIEEEFSNLTRYCLIRPAVNLGSLEEVMVILP